MFPLTMLRYWNPSSIVSLTPNAFAVSVVCSYRRLDVQKKLQLRGASLLLRKVWKTHPGRIDFAKFHDKNTVIYGVFRWFSAPTKKKTTLKNDAFLPSEPQSSSAKG